MPRRAPFIFAGNEIPSGSRATIDLQMARLYTHTSIDVPVHIIHGRREGPVLFLSAAIHGDEIIGVEIIRRLLKMKILSSIRGTILAVPIVNVYGFINQSRYSPDRRDLNRFFPGSKSGSLTSQLSHLFISEVVSKCEYGIDLHTGSNNRQNLPQVRAHLDNDETMRLAKAFDAPITLDAKGVSGTLRQTAMDMGIKMLLYETGEALRLDEASIKIGIRGVISFMRAIGMLSKAKSEKPEGKHIVSHSSTWVRSPISGIMNTRIKLGERVEEGQKIGSINDPYGEEEQPVFATTTGIIICRQNLPLVHRGDALFHIAMTNSDLVKGIADYHQEFDPD